MARNNSELHAIHFSIRGTMRTPPRMERLILPTGMKEKLTGIALEIFTDCCNVGVPFQDALLAIYLSGVEHGAYPSKEEDEPDAIA